MEVTHLPLFKILAYIYFGQGDGVLPPTVYEWGMEGETEVFRTSLNQMSFAHSPCSRWHSRGSAGAAR